MKTQNITDNITPPSNLEFLKKYFSHCFDKGWNFEFEKFRKEIADSGEVDFSKESYWMDWLWKSYARLLASDSATTLLQEDKEWNTKDENKDSENLLLKWDNLEILKHLSNSYYEKVKMIYIDPPYNTGSDGFVYNDDRKFTIEEFRKLSWVDEEQAKRVLDFVDRGSSSHSAWLTFMYPRLYIAKQLLKDDGVIFISIDDNEVAQLRLLMDEVFGEENFVGQLIWENKEWWWSSDSSNFRIKHEYVLSYSKTSNLSISWVKITNEKRYNEYDEFKNERWRYYLQKLGMWSIQYSKSLDFDIVTPDNTIIKPSDNNKWKKACWRWSKDKFERWIQNKFITFKKDKIWNWVVYTKQYLNCDNDWNTIKRTNRPMWVIPDYSSTQASKYLDKLFGIKVFNYSKPFQLIRYLISLSIELDDIILDFFAGSGTTWDAVMQLNIEDGWNRKFILAQLPEKIDPKKNKTAYDFVKDELGKEDPTIFEITKERLIRAAKKIQKDNKDSKEPKDLSTQDFGFKVFETTPILEDYDFDAEKLEEGQTLFDETQLTEQDLQNLLVTWKTYDWIALTQDLQELGLWEYKGYYADEKLYLINKWFTTDNLKALIEKIDNDPDFHPKVVFAFMYNFESKALREISEWVKNYANKKSIDIDFVVRS